MILILNILENIVFMTDSERREKEIIIQLNLSLRRIVIIYYTSMYASCTYSTGSKIFVILDTQNAYLLL